jgi:hypothetical protein
MSSVTEYNMHSLPSVSKTKTKALKFRQRTTAGKAPFRPGILRTSGRLHENNCGPIRPHYTVVSQNDITNPLDHDGFPQSETNDPFVTPL